MNRAVQVVAAAYVLGLSVTGPMPVAIADDGSSTESTQAGSVRGGSGRVGNRAPDASAVRAARAGGAGVRTRAGAGAEAPAATAGEPAAVGVAVDQLVRAAAASEAKSKAPTRALPQTGPAAPTLSEAPVPGAVAGQRTAMTDTAGATRSDAMPDVVDTYVISSARSELAEAVPAANGGSVAKAIATTPILSAAPAAAAPDRVTTLKVQVARVLDRAGDWLSGLPADPANQFLSGALLLARRTLLPDVPRIPAVAVGNTLVVEGEPGSTAEAVFTVTLDRAYDTDVTVGYATTTPQPSLKERLTAALTEQPPTDTPATAGADYTAVSGVLTFAPGQTSQQVRVTVLGDALTEDSETFRLTVYAALPAGGIPRGAAAAVTAGGTAPTTAVTDVALTSGVATIYDSGQWVELVGNGFNSPVRAMASYKDGFVVGLGSGAVQQWTGSAWQELHDTGWKTSVNTIVPYGDGFVVGLESGAVERWTGTSWTEMHDTGWRSDVKTMITYGDGFVVGLGNGAVQQWTGSAWRELQNSGWNSPVTTTIPYREGFVVGLGSGAVEQWTGTSWTEMHDTGWRSDVKTMTAYGDGFVVGLKSGSVQQWTGSAWRELQNSGWNSPVTTTIPYGEGFVVGLGSGAVQQWTGSAWRELQGTGWAHAVTKMLPFGEGFVVALENGSIQQWTGQTWRELQDAGWNSGANQIMSYRTGFVLGLQSGAVQYCTGPARVACGTSPVDTNTNYACGDALLASEFANLAYEHRKDAEFAKEVQATGWEGIRVADTDLGANGYSPAAGGYGVRDGLSVQSYAFAGKRTAADGTEQFVVAFEGTNAPGEEPPADWTCNLGEYGWSRYYASLQPLMAEVVRQVIQAQQDEKKTQLIITGHSLGGAAALMALADLMAPQGDLWPNTRQSLASGQRVLDKVGGWSSDTKAALLAATSVYTFGAPSILIDPTKPSKRWVVGSAIVGAVAPMFAELAHLARLLAAVQVDDKQLPDLSGFSAMSYAGRAFQFEHANTSWLPPYPGDIIAQIGSRDPGTVLKINLDNDVHTTYAGGRAWALVPGTVHPIAGYEESVIRLLTDRTVLKRPNMLAKNSPQLPLTGAGQGSDIRNDYFVNLSDDGKDGNDLFVFTRPGSYSANGGLGSDTYTVGNYGVAVVIDGSQQAGRDTLLFDLDGTPTVTYSNTGSGPRADTAVFSLTAADGRSANVTVNHWDQWQVSDVLQVIKPADGRWSFTTWTDTEHGTMVQVNAANEIPLSVL
jgi:hypothetical protein